MVVDKVTPLLQRPFRKASARARVTSDPFPCPLSYHRPCRLGLTLTVLLPLACSVTATQLSLLLKHKTQPCFEDLKHLLPLGCCSVRSSYSDTSLNVTSSKKPSLTTRFEEVTGHSVPAPYHCLTVFLFVHFFSSTVRLRHRSAAGATGHGPRTSLGHLPLKKGKQCCVVSGVGAAL